MRFDCFVKLKEFDTSAYLDNDERIAEYLTAALEDGNPDVFLSAVGNVAKARGMSAIAEHWPTARTALQRLRQAPNHVTTRFSGATEFWCQAQCSRIGCA
jgi:probable addiction module antidote protein